VSKHPCKQETHSPQVKKNWVLSWLKWFWFYLHWCNCKQHSYKIKRNVWYNLGCLLVLQTYCCLSIIEKLFISWQFFKTYSVINYGSGWRKGVTNQCLEFESYPQVLPVWMYGIKSTSMGEIVEQGNGYKWYFITLHWMSPGCALAGNFQYFTG